jgi:WD40 repeat protein
MDFLPDPGHLCLFQGAQFKIWKYPAGRRGQPEGPNSAQISLQNPFVTLGLDSFITWPIFSDDGLLSAYQARHGGIEIRRTVDWSLQQTLKGHQRTVFQFCFSPDGKQLASCSESDRAQEVKDWSIRLWDTSTGQQLLHLDHHEQSSHALMFSKDGRYLLSASWGLIMVWDVVSGRSNCIRRIHTATQYAGGFALSGDGRYMAAVVADTAIKVWDFEKDIIGYTPSTGGARPDVDGSCFCAFEHFQPHAYGGRCDTCLYGGWEHGGWRNSVDFAEGGRAK